ncbi:MAG: ankyrin repeat domain-containing protein, partial [Azovibrio sp.]
STNAISSGGIGLSMVAGIYGNSWIERRLKKSGYSLIHDTRSVRKTGVDAIEGSFIGEIWRGNTFAVLRMIEAGVDINETNSEGQTPLDVASIRGDISTILALLSKGAEGRLA